jgi:rod shape-determining protein MreC
VGVLVLLSLGLITASFRGHALDPVQGAAATGLRPFETAADRTSRPFRDAYGWASDLFHARAENKRLQRQIDELRSQAVVSQTAVQDLDRLKRLLAYRDSPRFPQDYDGIATRVIAQAPSRFEQQIVIAAGTADGLREDDTVVTQAGLVGTITKAFGHESRVALLTDGGTNVSAMDIADPSAIGIVRHGEGGSDVLVFDRVSKDKKVNEGDVVVTAGSPANDRLPSLYPRGVKIGVVTSVGQNDLDIFKQIQVQPFVSFSSLHSVLVLVPKSRLR